MNAKCKDILIRAFLLLLIIPTSITWSADGDVDLSFDAGEFLAFGGIVDTIAIQTDGKILIGGEFNKISGQRRNNIARLNSDGSLDAGFNPDVNGQVKVIKVQTDGKVLIGGQFTSVGSTARNNIARVNSDGSLDGDFNPNITGTSAFTFIEDIQIQSDDKILIGGSFDEVSGESIDDLARLNIDGTVDSGFSTRLSGVVSSIALQADGKILVGGSNLSIIGGGTFIFGRNVFRFNPNGNHDDTFNVDVATSSFFPDMDSVLIQPDGKILIGGRFDTVNDVSRNNLARLNADGTLDTGFNPNVDGAVNNLLLQSDGKIFLSGSFFISRININGTLDTSFDPEETLTQSMALQTDG